MVDLVSQDDELEEGQVITLDHGQLCVKKHIHQVPLPRSGEVILGNAYCLVALRFPNKSWFAGWVHHSMTEHVGYILGKEVFGISMAPDLALVMQYELQLRKRVA
eukprot:3433039-Amphidinium_carterae.1